METQKILQRKSARISYWLSRVAGANQTLIMLHGVASNHTRWSEFVLYTELKSEWNLLRLDLRGHGDSMYRGRINRHRWVADLHAIIKKEDLPSVVFLGHSLGAEIALDYTAGHPELVAGLILIDPVFHENLHGVLGWVRRLQYFLWLPIGILWAFNSLGLKRREF
ncbi:MAG: alpha/beta fold hydrolase, partial [Desulfobulbia bacterium]